MKQKIYYVSELKSPLNISAALGNGSRIRLQIEGLQNPCLRFPLLCRESVPNREDIFRVTSPIPFQELNMYLDHWGSLNPDTRRPDEPGYASYWAEIFLLEADAQPQADAQKQTALVAQFMEKLVKALNIIHPDFRRRTPIPNSSGYLRRVINTTQNITLDMPKDPAPKQQPCYIQEQDLALALANLDREITPEYNGLRQALMLTNRGDYKHAMLTLMAVLDILFRKLVKERLQEIQPESKIPYDVLVNNLDHRFLPQYTRDLDLKHVYYSDLLEELVKKANDPQLNNAQLSYLQMTGYLREIKNVLDFHRIHFFTDQQEPLKLEILD